MMQDYKLHINSLIKAHQAGEPGAADEAFRLLSEHDWTSRKKQRHVMLSGEHINEVESVYVDAFMNALDKFDPQRGDFVHYVNRSVENRVRSLGLDRKKRHERHTFECNWQPQDSSASFWDGMQPEFADCEILTPEDVILEDLSTEEKLEVIPVITQDLIDKMSDEEVSIAQAYMMTGSYREAAKVVGTYAVKVQRTLDKIQRLYDEARFGGIDRYFTVNTTRSRA